MTFHRIKAVALRELFASAASPAAWVFLIIFLVLAGFCAFVAGNVFASGQADISPFFDWIPYLFLLIVPALAMPMWAEERRVGVFELTLSFPASLWELVIGKYLAGMILLAAALLLTFSIPLTAWILGSPDTGAILCGYAGALLLGSVYLAMSSFCSALSRSQTASFLLSVFLCGVFLFIGLPSLLTMASAWLPDWLGASIASCSFLPNFQGYQKGLIDSAEVVYAVTLTGPSCKSGSVLSRKYCASTCGMFTSRTAPSVRLTRSVTARVMFCQASAALPKQSHSCANQSARAAVTPPSAETQDPTVRPRQKKPLAHVFFIDS